MSHEEWENIDCETDNHIPLVVPSGQASEHQTKDLGDQKQAEAVGDHERSVETQLPECLSTIHGRIDVGIFKFDRRISS